MKILVLNSGSSSQKSSLYEIRDRVPEIPSKPDWAGKIEWDGNQAELQVATAQGKTVKDALAVGVASRGDGSFVELLVQRSGACP